MKFMCVKGSNNSCPNSTILYNYQNVFIETFSYKCQAHSTDYTLDGRLLLSPPNTIQGLKYH